MISTCRFLAACTAVLFGLSGGTTGYFLVSAVLGQHGHHGHGHAQLHDDFYKNLQHNGFSCCSGIDCRPTSSRTVGDHYEVLVDGDWVAVPTDKIVKRAAPDGGAHVCAPAQIGANKGALYCVVLPPET